MNTDSARRQMVEQQIRTWDVFDPEVLDVFGRIPRDLFVPDDCSDVAYADTEIPLAHGQCMLRPNIVGRILQALEIQSADQVLEIGTGTGYLSACLASIAATVSSIDIFEDFVVSAKRNLAEIDVQNVHLQCMDAMSDLPDTQYDAVVVTGSVIDLDDRFVSLLKPGGRLFIVVGESPAMRAMLVTRETGNGHQTEILFETDIPRLQSVMNPPLFSF